MLDLLMLIMLLGAFAGAAAYITACINVTASLQPSVRDSQ